MTYEFQVITSLMTDVVHDISIHHHLGNHGKPPILEGVSNSDKVEDVGMRQVLPRDDFFTKDLYCVSEPRWGDVVWLPTLRILVLSSISETLRVLTTTVFPLSAPIRTSVKPPKAQGSSETSSLPDTRYESGMCPSLPHNLLRTVKACLRSSDSNCAARNAFTPRENISGKRRRRFERNVPCR